MTEKSSARPLAVGDRVRLLHGLGFAMPSGAEITAIDGDIVTLTDELYTMTFSREDVEREEGEGDDPVER